MLFSNSKRIIIVLSLIVNFQLINGQSCGVKSPETDTYVVNGKPANHGDIPWMTNVKFGYFVKRFICGASLLNDRWIVTAAHCVLSRLTFWYEITLGDWKINTNDGTEQVFSVERIIVHPEWKGPLFGDIRNDIALFKLNRIVTFNNYTSPVCLPKLDSDPTGDNALISGWGLTESPKGRYSDTLMKAFLKIITNGDCNEKTYGSVSDGNICVSDDNKGVCLHDSGGPLSHKLLDNKWELIGVTAWTLVPCGSYPSVYTRVSKYLDFINTNINETS